MKARSDNNYKEREKEMEEEDWKIPQVLQFDTDLLGWKWKVEQPVEALNQM